MGARAGANMIANANAKFISRLLSLVCCNAVLPDYREFFLMFEVDGNTARCSHNTQLEQ